MTPGNRWRETLSVLAKELARASQSHAMALEAARTDSLTQLWNRAGLNDEMAGVIAGHRAAGRSFSLLFVDIDHFKELNDHHGHVCGDDVLRQVATWAYPAQLTG